jgi:hypothetical protein
MSTNVAAILCREHRPDRKTKRWLQEAKSQPEMSTKVAAILCRIDLTARPRGDCKKLSRSPK